MKELSCACIPLNFQGKDIHFELKGFSKVSKPRVVEIILENKKLELLEFGGKQIQASFKKDLETINSQLINKISPKEIVFLENDKLFAEFHPDCMFLPDKPDDLFSHSYFYGEMTFHCKQILLGEVQIINLILEKIFI